MRIVVGRNGYTWHALLELPGNDRKFVEIWSGDKADVGAMLNSLSQDCQIALNFGLALVYYLD